MNLDRVGPGKNMPDVMNVIIEIPSNSAPVKYEVDKETGALFVDRFMNTAMFYPCNYGYVPETLSGDGDPADVLVVSPYPLLSGSVVECRPVGMLKMTDESGEDAKILAVPTDKMFEDIKSLEDLPKYELDRLSHFFEHYKDLEKNKWVKIGGWVGIEEAKAELVASVKLHNESK
ncbi:MAG: inorganic diphosphatase [Gammaproteobacteria bacterium]|nr:MAG: inorganic diphosphatase [Gammaproteobacteria bacterium]